MRIIGPPDVFRMPRPGMGLRRDKLGRLKLNGSIVSPSPLSRLIELEGLYLGVTGKLSPWTNLKASAGGRISSLDLSLLIERAISQQSRLEGLSVRAAAEALSAD